MPRAVRGFYQHNHGGIYFVPGIVEIDERTGEPRVLYFSVGDRVWITRAFEEFFGAVPSLSRPGVFEARFRRMKASAALKEIAIRTIQRKIIEDMLPLSASLLRQRRPR